MYAWSNGCVFELIFYFSNNCTVFEEDFFTFVKAFAIPYRYDQLPCGLLRVIAAFSCLLIFFGPWTAQLFSCYTLDPLISCEQKR